ncbi:MAG: hypothetical protein ABJP48_03860 [Erythrobacter sp.]
MNWRTHPSWFALMAMAAALSACSAGKTEQSSGDTEASSDADAAQPIETDSRGDVTFSESAWLSIGNDGAVYTTFFDADGSYRDHRNGIALQNGTWRKLEDARLCFFPEQQNRTGDCWSIGALEDNGTMRLTSSQGRDIEVRQVAYLAAESADAEAGSSEKAAAADAS